MTQNQKDEIIKHSNKRIIINSWEKPNIILVYVRNKKSELVRYTFVEDASGQV